MKNKKILIYGLLILVAIIFLFQSPLCPFSIGDSYTDSSVFRTIGWQMTKGMMPYRDTFDHKGPLIYLINYLGALISLDYGVWFFELLSLSLTLIYIYKISNLYNNTLFSFFTVMVSTYTLFNYFEQGNLVEEYAMPFVSISLYIFIKYFEFNNISIKELITCGFCFACVLMLRPNMIILWVMMCIGVLYTNLINNKKERILFYIKYFIIGMAIVIIPFFIWLLINKSFVHFINMYLIFNMKYVVKDVITISRIITSVKENVVLYPFFISLITIFANIKNNFVFKITYVLTLIIQLLSIAIGKPAPHYLMVIIPLYSYAIAIMFRDISNYKSSLIKITTCILLIAFSSFNWLYLVYSISKCEEKKPIIDKEIVKIITTISMETDTISIYGNRDLYYLESKRLPASKYSYQYPIIQYDSKIEKEYISEIKTNKPKCIIVCMNPSEELYKLLSINYILLYDNNSGAKIYIIKSI